MDLNAEMYFYAKSKNSHKSCLINSCGCFLNGHARDRLYVSLDSLLITDKAGVLLHSLTAQSLMRERNNNLVSAAFFCFIQRDIGSFERFFQGFPCTIVRHPHRYCDANRIT